jgi:hypothetical protein
MEWRSEKSGEGAGKSPDQRMSERKSSKAFLGPKISPEIVCDKIKINI